VNFQKNRSAIIKYHLSMKGIRFSLALCFLLLATPSQARRLHITNPLRTSSGSLLRVADPYVYESRGLYYLSASVDGGFDYYTSRDLLTWDSCGVLFRVPEENPVKTALWASEVAAHEGRFWLTYSGWDPRVNRLTIQLAVSEKPDGPFRIVKSPWICLPENGAIDAHIFWDKDGSPYVYFSENGHFATSSGGELRMARLKGDLSGIEGEILPVNPDRQSWEMHMKNPTDYCNEAPEVFLSGDTYYMTYSANETHNGNYGLGLQTAPSPLGPWRKAADNPIMQTEYEGPQTEYGLPAVSSPGHNGFIWKNKKHTRGYLIYHRHAPWVQAYPSNDRVTCLVRFSLRDGRIVLHR